MGNKSIQFNIQENEKMEGEQERLFEKFVVKYEAKEQMEKIAYQKKAYEKLLEQGIEKSGIDKLIETTNAEIQRQYLRKEQIENRSGFLLALWAIGLGIMLNGKGWIELAEMHGNTGYAIVNILLVILMIIFGFMTIIYIAKSILSDNIYFFDIKDQENNFECACEDKALFFVVLLKALSDAWELNEKMILKKGKNYNKALFSLVAFIAVIILANFF